MDASTNPADWKSSLSKWLRAYGPVVVLYALATWLTDAYSMGDTRIYVFHILEGSGYAFWEFGHVLWRPLGWLLYKAFLPLSSAIESESRLAVTVTLMAVAWLSGLICVLLVHALARRFSRRQWTTYLVTLAFLFSNAFINYAQTGHSYIPGLAFLLLGLYTLVRDPDSSTLKKATLAGTALALAVAMWFPYSLSVPAIIISPLLMYGFNRMQWRTVLQAGCVFAVVLALIYAAVAVKLGIDSPSGLQVWISSSAHGIDGMKGIPRMIFGFARSIINMGTDGRVFKRYVLGDPLNPVSLTDLFLLSLWKLALFYLFFLSVVVNLLFSNLGRRALTLLVLSAVPLVIFALFLFEAGTIDRYLPLYPMIFFAFAVSIGNDRLRSVPKYVATVFVVAAVATNAFAMSTFVLNRQQAAAEARVGELRYMIKPGRSRVITIGQEDPLYGLSVNFPFHSLNRLGLNTDMMADRGNEQVTRWRNIFATKTLDLWKAGGDVWVTKRIQHSRPSSDWEWVEGDDPRVTWNDLHSFFAQLEYGTAVGGEDGFVLLAPSTRNEQVLQRYVSKEVTVGFKGNAYQSY